jgi:predicted DsbA family dithiol-disulfide isomerase
MVSPYGTSRPPTARLWRNRSRTLCVDETVRVEIFSDVVCPWCAIGKRRFDRALACFSRSNEVDVVWRAFELDPSAPAIAKGDMATHLAEKYNMSLEQARASQAQLAAMAAQEGLDFHFERARRANTFDAHRLLHHARQLGMQDALKERLFGAYFTEGAAIGDRATLVRLAEEVGLDRTKSAEILEGGRYGDEVRADEADARNLGISGVPFFVIDGRYGISGAQNSETILRVLEEAWAHSHSMDAAVGEDGTCGDEQCQLPR